MKRLVLLIICLILVPSFLSCNFAPDFSNQYDGSDFSPKYIGEILYWKGHEYHVISGNYIEGKTIAQTPNREWNINEVVGDKAHNFVVVRSFLDQYLLVRDDYNIPKNGEITAVYYKGRILVEDESFCSAVSAVITEKNTKSFTFTTSNIEKYADSIVLCYEKSPVGTNFVGYIGSINDKLVYIPTLPKNRINTDGSPKEYKVTCQIISNELIAIINKYIV